MKFFKKLFLVVPLLISLASCSSNKSLAGTYSFQLGSDTGTHAGIHLTLKDDLAEDAEVAEGVVAKKFNLKFDIGTSSTSGVVSILTHLDTVIEYIETHTEIDFDNLEELVQKLEEVISKEGGEDIPLDIPGYYYTKEVTNAANQKETRIMMGVDLNLIKDLPITIPDSLVEMLMYATYSNDNINIIIPVSVTDLLYQIYWYGYRIAGIESLVNPVDLHEENAFMKHNDIGSHPTKQDVKSIQEYQAKREETQPTGYEAGEFIYTSYFDYHTLTMGLSKNGK